MNVDDCIGTIMNKEIPSSVGQKKKRQACCGHRQNGHSQFSETHIIPVKGK